MENKPTGFDPNQELDRLQSELRTQEQEWIDKGIPLGAADIMSALLKREQFTPEQVSQLFAIGSIIGIRNEIITALEKVLNTPTAKEEATPKRDRMIRITRDGSTPPPSTPKREDPNPTQEPQKSEEQKEQQWADSTGVNFDFDDDDPLEIEDIKPSSRETTRAVRKADTRLMRKKTDVRTSESLIPDEVANFIPDGPEDEQDELSSAATIVNPNITLFDPKQFQKPTQGGEIKKAPPIIRSDDTALIKPPPRINGEKLSPEMIDIIGNTLLPELQDILEEAILTSALSPLKRIKEIKARMGIRGLLESRETDDAETEWKAWTRMGSIMRMIKNRQKKKSSAIEGVWNHIYELMDNDNAERIEFILKDGDETTAPPYLREVLARVYGAFLIENEIRLHVHSLQKALFDTQAPSKESLRSLISEIQEEAQPIHWVLGEIKPSQIITIGNIIHFIETQFVPQFGRNPIDTNELMIALRNFQQSGIINAIQRSQSVLAILPDLVQDPQRVKEEVETIKEIESTFKNADETMGYEGGRTPIGTVSEQDERNSEIVSTIIRIFGNVVSQVTRNQIGRDGDTLRTSFRDQIIANKISIPSFEQLQKIRSRRAQR